MNEKQAKKIVLLLTISVALHGSYTIAILWALWRLMRGVHGESLF